MGGRLQRHNDAIDSPTKQFRRPHDIPDSGIHYQFITALDQLLQRVPVGTVLHQGVEVGHIQQSPVGHTTQSPGDLDRIARSCEPAVDWLIRVALAGDTMDDHSLHQVQYRDDVHGRQQSIVVKFVLVFDLSQSGPALYHAHVSHVLKSEVCTNESRPESRDPSNTPQPDRSWWPCVRRSGVVRLGVLIVIPYVLVVGMLAALQRSLIYQPRREQVGVPGEFAAGCLHQIQVAAEDGTPLHGWVALAEGSSAQDSDELRHSLTSDRPLVLYFCGNAGHRGYRANKIAMFNRLGCDVMIVDYRGYAENTGSPSERAFTQDAQAVWNHATQLLGVPSHRIVLCGESLGGGVATRLAADLCEQGTEPGGLMLRATFSSLVDAAAWHYPWLPVRWVLVDRYPSIDRITEVTCPLLQIHGRQDHIVPFEQGEHLFDAAPERSSKGVPKTFVELPHADHNNIMAVAGDQVEAVTARYLQSVRSGLTGSATLESAAVGE